MPIEQTIGQPDQNQPYSYLSDPRRDHDQHYVKQAGAGSTVDIQTDTAFQTTAEGSMQGTQGGSSATVSGDVMHSTIDNPLLQPGTGGSTAYLSEYLDWLESSEGSSQGSVADTDEDDNFDPLSFAQFVASANQNVDITAVLNGDTSTPTGTQSSLTLAQLYEISDLGSTDSATVLEVLKMLCSITGTPSTALQNLAEKIAESNDPTSPNYGTIDLSSEDPAKLSATLTTLMGSDDPTDVQSLSTGLAALNTQLAADLQSGDPVTVYNAVLASMGEIIPVDVSSTNTASTSTPCTSAQLSDVAGLNSQNQADVLSALLDLAGEPPPEPGSDIYNNLNTLAGQIALANAKGGLNGLYAANSTSVWQAIKNLITNNGTTTIDQPTMDLLDNVLSGNIGNLNAQYELDLQSTNPNIAMSAYLAGEGILLSPATTSDTSDTVAIPFSADQVTEEAGMQSTDPSQVFAALLKLSGLTASSDPSQLATLYQLAQEIASSNDPNSPNYGSIDLSSGTDTDLATSLENGYTLGGGSASDIEALLSGTSLATNLASLNTAFSAVPEAQVNASLTALGVAAGLPPSPDVETLIATLSSGTATASPGALTLAPPLSDKQLSQFSSLNSQDSAQVLTALETLTGIPAPVPPAQPTPQFQSLQNMATQIASANSGQPVTGITPDILSELSSEDPSSVLDGLTQIYQQTDPNGGTDQTFISALGLASNTMSELNAQYDAQISASDPTQSYSAFMAKLGNPPPYQAPTDLPSATITVAQPLTTDQLMDLSNLNSQSPDDVYNALLLMMGLTSSTVTDAQQTEIQALATQIANANSGQAITDASGASISPNLQEALMKGLTSQNSLVVAQALQQLYTATGGTDTSLTTLFNQAGGNIAAFYIQANLEINASTADPTDVTNVQLALTGALTTSSTAGTAQASLTIDQRTDEQNLCSTNPTNVLEGLEALAGITDPTTLTTTELNDLTAMAQAIAAGNSSGGMTSLESETVSDLQTALQGIYGGSDSGTTALLGTIATNLSALNVQFDQDMQSPNSSVVLAAMEARSSLDTQNLTPAEKKVALSYLQLLATALAFMSQLRAELSQKETESETQQNQAKLQEANTLINNAINKFNDTAKLVAQQVAEELAAQAQKEMMGILGPVLTALAGVAAVLIEVFTLGTGSAVAVALILCTIATTALMVADQTTGFLTNALTSAGLSPAAAQGVEAAMYAIMAVCTFGAGAAAAAAGAVTRAVIEAVMLMVIQSVFSTGLVTTMFQQIAQAAWPNDPQAQLIFSIIMTVFTMIVCCKAAGKMAGSMAARIASNAAQAAETATAAAAASDAAFLDTSDATMVANPLMEGSDSVTAGGDYDTSGVTMTANPLVDGSDTAVNVGAAFRNKSAVAAQADAIFTDEATAQQAAATQTAKTATPASGATVAGRAGGPQGGAQGGDADVSVDASATPPGGEVPTEGGLQTEASIQRTNRLLSRIGDRLKEFFSSMKVSELSPSAQQNVSKMLILTQLIQGLMQAGLSFQQYQYNEALGHAQEQQAQLTGDIASLSALYSYVQQMSSQFDKTIQELQGDIKGINDLVIGLDKMFEDFLNSMRAVIP